MLRVLAAPDFEISVTDPDFPPDFLDMMKTARDVTGSNYVSFWSQARDGGIGSRVVVTTYPAKWLQRYVEKNYQTTDPTLVKTLGGVGAVIFDHNNPKEDEPEDLAHEAIEAGIGRFTIGIPTHIGKNVECATTFGTDKDVGSDSEEMSETLIRCREQAHIITVAVADRFYRKEQQLKPLSRREIEVLQWGASGKTDAETAKLMDISRWTVVGHVQSAKAKLRVTNKAAAIARALELKLFE